MPGNPPSPPPSPGCLGLRGFRGFRGFLALGAAIKGIGIENPIGGKWWGGGGPSRELGEQPSSSELEKLYGSYEYLKFLLNLQLLMVR